MPNKNHDDILKKIAEANRRRLFGISKKQIQRPEPSSHLIKKKVAVTNAERPVKQHQRTYNRSVFISGGIGDVMAVESFMTDEEVAKIETVFYATKKKEPIEQLIKVLLPNVHKHISVWDDFSKFWCFYSKNDCLSKVARKLPNLREPLSQSYDLSIGKIFDEIRNGRRIYTGSRFLKTSLSDISGFELPNEYCVICPYSTDKRIKNRDFDQSDWSECIKYLENLGIKGVVINKGDDIIPEDPNLINLANKTSIAEAVEVLKSAKCYIGIDSWLSVLSAKLFEGSYLQIKSNNKHCHNNAMFYYAPKRDFSFMVNKIQSFR